MKSITTLFLLVAVAQVAMAQSEIPFTEQNSVSASFYAGALTTQYNEQKVYCEIGNRYDSQSVSLKGGYKLPLSESLFFAPGLGFSIGKWDKGKTCIGGSLKIAGEFSFGKIVLASDVNYSLLFPTNGYSEINQLQTSVYATRKLGKECKFGFGYTFQAHSQKKSTMDILNDEQEKIQLTTPSENKFCQGPTVQLAIQNFTIAGGPLFFSNNVLGANISFAFKFKICNY